MSDDWKNDPRYQEIAYAVPRRQSVGWTVWFALLLVGLVAALMVFGPVVLR